MRTSKAFIATFLFLMGTTACAAILGTPYIPEIDQRFNALEVSSAFTGASPTFTGTTTVDILTATGAISGSNLSGTNTGDVTLGAFGSTANANGASLSGQVLTLQPASASFPGGITTGTQTIAGAKTYTANMVLTTSTTTAASFRNTGAATSQVIVGNTAGDLVLRTDASGNGFIYSDTGKFLAFGANGSTEKARLTSAGVFTHAAAISTARLDVASAATIAQLSSAQSFVRLTGSTATTLNGILAGVDGQRLTLFNITGQNLTISNENAGATAADRITTMTGADVVSTANSAAEFIYDTGSSRWITISVNP